MDTITIWGSTYTREEVDTALESNRRILVALKNGAATPMAFGHGRNKKAAIAWAGQNVTRWETVRTIMESNNAN